jgi:hypothetical protein
MFGFTDPLHSSVNKQMKQVYSQAEKRGEKINLSKINEIIALNVMLFENNGYRF